MIGGESLSFDLVVATIGRQDELEALLRSLENQTHQNLSLLVVDQNDDRRVAEILNRHPALRIRRLVSSPGLSRARNAALPFLEADVVGFPDDDCVYPDGLLETVAAVFTRRPDLDALSGQAADPDGRPSGRWPRSACTVDLDTHWNRANSHTIFLRRSLVERVGGFDEALGLGSGRRWSSGEETDYIVRALHLGARIEYDPEVVVLHPARRLTAEQERTHADSVGASVGVILAQGGYSARAVARMVVRPVGGAAASLLRGDVRRARYHLATVRGRIAGYRAGRRLPPRPTKSSSG